MSRTSFYAMMRVPKVPFVTRFDARKGECMSMKEIDLHMHSTVSDGSDTPDELVRNVQKAGIRTFALTDHDTILGALEVEKLLRPEPECSSLEFFRGIEFSCRAEDESRFKCHLLGYQYDPENEKFQYALKLGRGRRMQKLDSRIGYLRSHGAAFSDREIDWLHSLESPGKPHIADLMIRDGYAENRQEAIDRIHCEEKIETRIPADVAIEGILAAGGVPVWAHPLGGEGEEHISEAEFERRLQYLTGNRTGRNQDGDTCPAEDPAPAVMGIECWYSRYSEEEVSFLLRMAEKYGLLVSGGSDYHGTRKNIKLGELNTFGKPVMTDQLTIIEELRKRV